jgi:hypothetical protein
MNSRVKCGLINVIILSLISILFLTSLSFLILGPVYDSSRDPPINGICLGDQIVKLRECINPTCLEGYIDAGICVEPTQYSFLSPYSDLIKFSTIFSGVFFVFVGILEILYFSTEKPFNNRYHSERELDQDRRNSIRIISMRNERLRNEELEIIELDRNEELAMIEWSRQYALYVKNQPPTYISLQTS